MQSHPVFPPELLDIIVDHVPYSTNAKSARKDDSESAATLLNCSLVSSSFRDKAQKRLFNDVHVQLPPYDERQIVLNEVLSSSARLRTFVVKLRLELLSFTKVQVEFNPALPNLTDLWITGHRFKWNDAETYESKLYTLIRGPTLSRLTIRHIHNFPISALSDCGQLTQLSTYNVKFNSTGIDNVPVLTSPVRQTYLKTIYSDFIFPELVTALVKPSFPLSTARLQKLSLNFFRKSICPALKMVLDEAGPYLNHLELSFHSGFELSWDDLNLPNPSILRHVTFKNPLNDMSRIISFLSQIPEVNKLAGVLFCRTRAQVMVSGIPGHDKDSFWQLLDEVLTRERHAVHFQRLELRGVMTLYVRMDELKARASRLLPRLTASNRVVVT